MVFRKGEIYKVIRVSPNHPSPNLKVGERVRFTSIPTTTNTQEAINIDYLDQGLYDIGTYIHKYTWKPIRSMHGIIQICK